MAQAITPSTWYFSPIESITCVFINSIASRPDDKNSWLDALMLPGFQRRWGSVYDALSAGRIDTTGVEGLVAQYPLEGGECVYAVDSSTWRKDDAETSPQRGYYHHHNRHSAGKPIVAGWSYQWLAQVSFRHDSWCAPLSAQRVEPMDNMHQVAATQIRALLKRRPQHEDVPVFVFTRVMMLSNWRNC